MRKHIFNKKRPEEATEKQPKAKNPLLQAYFSSLLSLVLCMTMFFGTSYAWFTSEVINEGNEIYIGVLDVELEKLVHSEDEGTDPSWVSLSATEQDGDNSYHLFDGTKHWEPNTTFMETIKVVNKGDLAFNYTLSFTDGSGKNRKNEPLSDETWKEAAGYFDVWVYEHDADEDTPKVIPYADFANSDSGWKSVGTLAEVLAGKHVLEGTMDTVRKDGQDEADINAGTQDGVATEKLYTIALHMRSEANAAVMGYRINLHVKLVAYQMVAEKDDLGDNKYDNIVIANTVDELNAALTTGGNVALTDDIELDGTAVAVPKGVTATLDLNGHNITGNGGVGDSLIENNGDLTITGNGKIAMTFNGTVDNKAVNAISNRGVLTINGGEISNTGTGDQIGYAIDNYNGATLIVNDGKIIASDSSSYDGIRLFCGSNETVVTVNGGQISTIWAQNPSANKATEVKGTVIVNGGKIGTVYYENYTTVQVKDGVNVTDATAAGYIKIAPYGAGKDKTTSEPKDGYTVYSFLH